MLGGQSDRPTSVFNYLCQCNGFDLAENTLGKSLYCHAAACGLGSKEFLINAVELCKVIHICKEAGGLENLACVAACGLNNGQNILAALLCLSGYSLGNIAGSGIYGDLTGGIYKTVYDIALGIGADCAGCIGGSNNSHFVQAPSI